MLGVAYDGTKFYVFDDPVKMGAFFHRRQWNGWRWFAHNLAYDLRNIFGQVLPFHTTLIGGKVYIAKIRLGHSRREWIHFNDSSLHFPAPLSELAKALEMEKLAESGEHARSMTREQLTDYCKQDTLIVYEFVTNLQRTYLEVGGQLNATIGSTALNCWRRQFQTEPFLQLDRAELESLNKSYYGGRCEAFRVGELQGRWTMADVNSMYPSVMRDLEVGLPDRRHCWRRKGASRDVLDLPGSSLAELEVPGDLDRFPPLPYRSKAVASGKLVFPVGRLRAWWPHSELRYARDLGVKIRRLQDSIWFDRSLFPFRAFVERMFALRARGGFYNLTGKLISNNLYGKFSQCRPPGKLLTPEDYLQARLDGEINPVDTCDELKDADGNVVMILTTPDGLDFPVHSNQHWGAEITAGARIRLHKLLTQFGGVYCDTDSVLTQSVITGSKALGDLSVKSESHRVVIRGPKAYLLDSADGREIRLKGVPRRRGFVRRKYGWEFCESIQQEAFDGHEVGFTAPLKLLESYRRTKLPEFVEHPDGRVELRDASLDATKNTWHAKTKLLKLTYDKRRVLPDGTTRALVVRDW